MRNDAREGLCECFGSKFLGVDFLFPILLCLLGDDVRKGIFGFLQIALKGRQIGPLSRIFLSITVLAITLLSGEPNTFLPKSNSTSAMCRIKNPMEFGASPSFSLDPPTK